MSVGNVEYPAFHGSKRIMQRCNPHERKAGGCNAVTVWIEAGMRGYQRILAGNYMEGAGMYCVIQEISIKNVRKGTPKEILVHETRISNNGMEYSIFGYHYSQECFERPIRKSYRISIHQSYRENGKVRKKQLAICTVGYYDIIDCGEWPGNYIVGGMKKKADALGLAENELEDLIYTKWQGIADKVREEFQQTGEYAAMEKQGKILSEYIRRKDAFAKKFGIDRDEYDRCYDVFGELRNPEYFEKIKADFQARKEYEQKSWEQSRSYYEKFNGNYGERSGSGYYRTAASNYSETDKYLLKKFYRSLSKAFHPDSNPNKDTSEEMKMLNRLKNEWGI